MQYASLHERHDAAVGDSLAEGRHAAHAIDEYLMGHSDLPKPLEHGNDRRPFA